MEGNDLTIENEFKELKEELSNLTEKKGRIEKNNRSIIIFATTILAIVIIISILVVSILEYKLKDVIPIDIAIGIYILLFPILIFLNSSTQVNNRIFEVKSEMDLLNIGTEALEKRAEKQLRVHQGEVKRYYDQSLSHSKWIFVAGLVSLLAGMIIVIVTITLIVNSSERDNNLIIALTGGTTGILTNFVGVVFLKMYSETVRSLNIFHNRLVTTHHLHFSNFLISKIYDRDLREQTWAKLALSLTEINIDKGSEKERIKEG
ncbi:TRADD-N-associated membrane domain-containing protein [Paenibacillus sp. CGMCC 1.18879]|uniref:TRADD-N-associated membrane domain-containing protein n=2 Tax=Paenibacillus TaxID=44249 RepID=UPI001CA80D3D|nr:hypothetical protein [Paenibacillus sp. CGMCC 1.18879]MBY9079532.1 hypothetical protein [Paenibacillus sp. CGMCC 1.18879]